MLAKIWTKIYDDVMLLFGPSYNYVLHAASHLSIARAARRACEVLGVTTSSLAWSCLHMALTWWGKSAEVLSTANNLQNSLSCDVYSSVVF